MVRHLGRVKQGTRTCGAVLLNPKADKLLLVKGFGSRCWGWPKGKIEEGESDRECAAREVREEVGLDIAGRIQPRHFLTLTIRRQSRGLRTSSVLKLFIIANVPEDAVLRTETVHEIERIAWVPLDAVAPPSGAPPHATGKVKTFLVREVLQRLRVWISENLKGQKLAVGGAQRNKQRGRERDGERSGGKCKMRGRSGTPPRSAAAASSSPTRQRTGSPQSARLARTGTPQSPTRTRPPVPESARPASHHHRREPQEDPNPPNLS